MIRTAPTSPWLLSWARPASRTRRSVRAIAARRSKVFTRWSDMATARIGDATMIDQAEQHQGCPQQGSVIMKTTARLAERRAGWPGWSAADTATARTITEMRARPEVARCASSTRGLKVVGVGITCPLQRGQCSPQPFPRSWRDVGPPDDDRQVIDQGPSGEQGQGEAPHDPLIQRPAEIPHPPARPCSGRAPQAASALGENPRRPGP